MTPLEALRCLQAVDVQVIDLQVMECLADTPVSVTWRVELTGRQAVLRVDRPLAARLGLQRAAEPAVLRAVAARDLGPRLLAADPERGLLLTEWLEGATWKPGGGRGGLRQVARLLRAVHAVPVRAPVLDLPVLDLAAVIGRYAGLAGPAGAALAQEARARLAACLDRPGLPPAFCHNDPSPPNILDTASATVSGTFSMPHPIRDNDLRLIDWEYAGINRPEFDLAVFTAEAGLAPPAGAELLEAYLERPPEPAESRCHAAWLAFYRSLSLLWQQAVVAPGRGPAT
ncbi:MAG: choline/ethanolamine kinase family protein [Gammaproteobacteria bacterium]